MKTTLIILPCFERVTTGGAIIEDAATLPGKLLEHKEKSSPTVTPEYRSWLLIGVSIRHTLSSTRFRLEAMEKNNGHGAVSGIPYYKSSTANTSGNFRPLKMIKFSGTDTGISTTRQSCSSENYSTSPYMKLNAIRTTLV